MSNTGPERNLARRRFLAGSAGTVAVGAGIWARPAAAGPPGPTDDGVPTSLNLRDFGAVGDGKTDDTAAVRRALGPGGPVTRTGQQRAVTGGGLAGGIWGIPPGEYLLSDTVKIDRMAGALVGTGMSNPPNAPYPSYLAGQGTVFRWVGAADKPMFQMTDSRHLTFSQLVFVGNDQSPPSAALNFRSDGGAVGSNEFLSVEDCAFGLWPWALTGANTGVLRAGISVDGANANNDQFRINRCVFSGRADTATTGVLIANSQSIWGSLTDCCFIKCTVGLDTASSVTLRNAQFDSCLTDLSVRSTASVDLFGWNSEHSGRLVNLEPHAAVRATGGTCQLDKGRMTTMITAHPSDSGQTISLRDMRFMHLGGSGHRPAIEFGPDDPHGSAKQGFLVNVDSCTGLYADQCDMTGSLWGAEPESRGLVSWYSRTEEGIVQFRNELWAVAHPGTRSSIDTNAWDPPRPGSN